MAKKKAISAIGAIVFVTLVALVIYADHFGNVKLQEAATDLLKLTVGAVIGALANEYGRK